MLTTDNPSKLLSEVRTHDRGTVFVTCVCSMLPLRLLHMSTTYRRVTFPSGCTAVLFDPLLAGGHADTPIELNLRYDECRACSMCFGRTPSTSEACGATGTAQFAQRELRRASAGR